MNANAGDKRRQRFDALVAVCYEDMFRYAAWLCRDRAIADDVVQESLLRAWKSLDSLRDDAAAKPWLLTIVRRENARYFERRRLDTVDIDELGAAQAAELAHAPDEELLGLREAMLRLEDDYREPLVLQVLVGFSTREIAAHMGLSQGAVLTRLHRARQKLKDDMDSRDIGN